MIKKIVNKYIWQVIDKRSIRYDSEVEDFANEVTVLTLIVYDECLKSGMRFCSVWMLKDFVAETVQIIEEKINSVILAILKEGGAK